MAIESVADWSTTASENTSLGSTIIKDGHSSWFDWDDALREMMAQLKTKLDAIDASISAIVIGRTAIDGTEEDLDDLKTEGWYTSTGGTTELNFPEAMSTSVGLLDIVADEDSTNVIQHFVSGASGKVYVRTFASSAWGEWTLIGPAE